jgi:type I restriction enzyme R subunit
MTGEARELFARFIADGDVGRFAEDLPGMMRGAFGPTMNILRDADFQKLLVDYPRGQRTFIIAPGVSDEVMLRA